jgi:hypothetical protein
MITLVVINPIYPIIYPKVSKGINHRIGKPAIEICSMDITDRGKAKIIKLKISG